MGFRFRKSFGNRFFKTTISKSGISYSAGVPGFRKTKLANGKTRTTYSIPKTGLSYVTDEKQNNKITRKEVEKEVIQQSSINPENFYDLIPFTQIEEKMLFIIGFYAGVLNSYQEGAEIETDVRNLLIPFKIVDVNNAAEKMGEERKYTSSHLSKMVDKGYFVRESRGIYKLNEEIVVYYTKQFLEIKKQEEERAKIQEQMEKELKEQVAKQREQKQKRKEEKIIRRKEIREKWLPIQKIIAIITTCLGLGLFGIPSFIMGDWILGCLSFFIVILFTERFTGLVILLTMIIIPIISIKQYFKKKGK